VIESNAQVVSQPGAHLHDARAVSDHGHREMSSWLSSLSLHIR
jgi:hypothetical protein